MDNYEHIVGLRATREYRDQQVSDGDLQRILEAARWTGSAANRQLWSFVVVTDPEQKARLADCGTYSQPVRDAPLAIALVQEEDGYEFDSGRLAQNIMLAADAIGLVSCPITLHREDQAHEVLGLRDGARSRYAIAIGYPTGSLGTSYFSGRKPLEELVHENSY